MKKEPSYAKLNLTLRVVGRLSSGFHELTSIFLKIGPVDYLTISRSVEDNVKVIFERIKSIIDGRNILLKTLDLVRDSGAQVPALDMIIEKNVPPGTGLGCGSGNAAALLRYLEAGGFSAYARAANVGADVPFFCGESSLALAEGIGEKLSFLDDTGLNLRAAVVVPRWRCLTPEMFRRLDAEFPDRWPTDAETARDEAREVLQKLRENSFCGLLPNDFCSVLMKEHREYENLFGDFARQGALAWGISGSGSAAFGLWNRETYGGFSTDFPWVEDVLIF